MYHKNTRYQSSKFFLKSTRPVGQVFPNCTRPIPPALPHRSLTLDYFNIDTGLAYDSVRCSDAQIVSGSKSWKAFKFHGCGYVLVINIFTFHFLPQMYWWHLIVYIEGNLYFFYMSPCCFDMERVTTRNLIGQNMIVEGYDPSYQSNHCCSFFPVTTRQQQLCEVYFLQKQAD